MFLQIQMLTRFLKLSEWVFSVFLSEQTMFKCLMNFASSGNWCWINLFVASAPYSNCLSTFVLLLTYYSSMPLPWLWIGHEPIIANKEFKKVKSLGNNYMRAIANFSWCQIIKFCLERTKVFQRIRRYDYYQTRIEWSLGERKQWCQWLFTSKLDAYIQDFSIN